MIWQAEPECFRMFRRSPRVNFINLIQSGHTKKLDHFAVEKILVFIHQTIYLFRYSCFIEWNWDQNPVNDDEEEEDGVGDGPIVQILLIEVGVYHGFVKTVGQWWWCRHIDCCWVFIHYFAFVCWKVRRSKGRTLNLLFKFSPPKIS